MVDFLKRGEQLVLSSPVDLKNRTGTLYLTTDRLQWVETNDTKQDHTIYFGDIRSTLVSNATSKRVCLKLVTKQDPLGSVFYFTSANARAELDHFKDTLCKLSKEKSSSKADRESDEKKEPFTFAGLELTPMEKKPNNSNNNTNNSPTSNANNTGNNSGNNTNNGNNNGNTNTGATTHGNNNNGNNTGNNNNGNNHNTNGNNNNGNNNTGNKPPSSQHYRGVPSPESEISSSPPINATPSFNSTNNTYNNVSPSNDSTKQHSTNAIGYNNTRNNNFDTDFKSNLNTTHEISNKPNNKSYQNGSNVPKGDEDDFYSIDEEFGNEAGKDGGLEVEVRDPQKEVDPGSKVFVSYEVVWSRQGQPQQKVRRRYKDFEWLHSHIVGNYQHRTTIPPFPSKSILKTIGSSLPYISSTDNAEFTQKRCLALDKFMKSFARSPILLQSKSLQVFLSHASIEHDPSLGGVAGFLGKVESTLSGSAGNRRLDDIDVADQNFSDVEMDYKQVRELMMRWDLTPKKLPFEKFLVVVLGTTSAGKSAFVNHFFGLQVKRSAVGQMDTHFTLVEVLSKEKFAEYSDKASTTRPNFTDAELSKKISGDVYADPRYGYVFFYLDTFKTLSRYEAQFTNYAHYITNYGLVRSIIINEEYLRGPQEKIQIAKRTIVLDSPGFDYTKENEHAMEKFLGNLKILQLFYSMSDLSLFMTPATHINMVSNQIATLELSVLYSLHGAEYVDKLLHEILAAPTNGGNGPTHLIPSIVDIKNYVVQKFMHAASAALESKKAEYKGTVVWDKLRFVLTKIDEVFVNQPVGNLHEQFYELGRLLGKNLTYLEAPTFSQCLAIGLPEHQMKGESDAKTGDLKVLMDLIRSLNSESSYMGRLEASVQMMCLELQSAIKASWSTWISPKQWMSSDTNQLQDIYRRSCLRLKKMSTNGGGGAFTNTPHVLDEDYSR